MSKSANDVKVGNIIDYKGGLWRVLKSEHVKPGKGGAFCQMELKEIKTGTKLNERFRSTETIDVAHFEEKQMQYLYSDGTNIALMDSQTFEQTEINVELFGGKQVYLQDGMIVTLEIAAEQIIAAKVPNHVTLEVTEAEAVVKGQTVSTSNKPAVMENGVKIMVPQFIEAGMKIVVNTEEEVYVKRAE